VTSSPLDDNSTYARLDGAGLYGRIAGLADQVEQAVHAASAIQLPAGYAGVSRVAVLGMGGSGIGGSLLRDLAIALESPASVEVVRGYTLPAHVGADTLAIASSNSGNTEEVLSLVEQAHKRGTRCLALTTGGRLGQFATENAIPMLEYTWDGEPRAALGWSFATLVEITRSLGLLPKLGSDARKALAPMRQLCTTIDREVPLAENPAKQLATRLVGKAPVIVGAEAMTPVAYRWRTQMNENAKTWAFAEELPEMNHNAPVGFGGPAALLPQLRVMLLRHATVHARIDRRINLTLEQLSQAGIAAEVIDVAGAQPLEQMLWAIQLGDFVSYYLGLLNGADPSEVRALDWLKSRMAAD
jgi:glucose/mannose-6-phosphate isomerase